MVGIDLAKNVLQVCALGTNGSVLWGRKVTRPKFVAMLANLPKTALIAMGAYSSLNFWGRYLSDRGYRVALVRAQHAKSFAKRQKNDANDALAICEAATRPGIDFVSVKTIKQQDIKASRTIRRRRVQQRTTTSNQIRTIAGEYGVVFPIGLRHLHARSLTSFPASSLNSRVNILRALIPYRRDHLYTLSRYLESRGGRKG